MKKKTKLLTLAAASLLSLGLAAGITVHVMNDEPVHDDVLVDEIGGEDAVGSYNAFPARAIDPSELDAIHGTIGVQLLGEEGNHSVRFVVALSGYQGLESASFTRTVKASDGTVIMQEKVLGIRQVYSSVASAATIDWGGEAPSATDYPYYMVYTMNKISKEYEYATIEVKFTAEQLANPDTPLTATEKANVKGLIGQTETYDYLNFQEIEDTSDIYEKPGEYRAWENDKADVPADIVIPEDYVTYEGHVATLLGKVVAVEDPNTSYGAFESSYDIVNVTLPDTIRYLDKWCFSSASNLKTLNIPASVKSVKSSAFNSVNLNVLHYDAISAETWEDEIPSVKTMYVSSGVTSLPNALIVGDVDTIYYDGLTADWNALNDGKTTGLDIDNVICNDTQVATITFHTNGGTFTVNGAETTEDFTLDVIVGKLIPDVGRGKKDGLVFQFWSTSEDGSTGSYDFETAVAGDMDLYAIFGDSPAGSSMDKPLVVNVEANNQQTVSFETNVDVPLLYMQVNLPANGRYYFQTDLPYGGKMWVYAADKTTAVSVSGSLNPSIDSAVYPVMGSSTEKLIFNTTEAITYYVVLAYGYDYKIDGPNADEYGTININIFDSYGDTLDEATAITSIPSTQEVTSSLGDNIKHLYTYTPETKQNLVLKMASDSVSGRVDTYTADGEGGYDRGEYVTTNGQKLITVEAGQTLYIEAYAYNPFQAEEGKRFYFTLETAPQGLTADNPSDKSLQIGVENVISCDNIGGFAYGYYPLTIADADSYRVIISGGSYSAKEVKIYKATDLLNPVLTLTASEGNAVEELLALDAGEYIVGVGYTSEYATKDNFTLEIVKAVPGYSIDYPITLETSWADNSLTLEGGADDIYYYLTDGIGGGWDVTVASESVTSVEFFGSNKKSLLEIEAGQEGYVKLEAEATGYYILVPGSTTEPSSVTLTREVHIGPLTGSPILGEYYGVRNGGLFYMISITADGHTWESNSTVHDATNVVTTDDITTFSSNNKNFTADGDYVWVTEGDAADYFYTRAEKTSYNSSALSGECITTSGYLGDSGVIIQSLMEGKVEGSPRAYGIKIDGVIYLGVNVAFTSDVTSIESNGAAFTITTKAGVTLGSGVVEAGNLVWTPAA